jgi:pimeloyl-ACP methyl ester carboxylesterase
MGEGPIACRPGDAAREGRALAREHDRARTNTLLVIPQLALLERDGSPGCFGRPGCFRRFLQELLSGPLADRLGGQRELSDVAGISLVAHSAGFQTALAILERGQVDSLVRHVVLFDALYSGTDGFARWLRSAKNVKLVSVHLGRGKTARNSQQLYQGVRRALGPGAVAEVRAAQLAARVADRRLVVAHGRGPHGRVPEQHLAELLRALWPDSGAARP